MESVYVIGDVALQFVALVCTIRVNQAYTIVFGTALLLAICTDGGYALVQERLVVGSILDGLRVRRWNATPVDDLVVGGANSTVFLLLLDF